jgi:hypothetical protein
MPAILVLGALSGLLSAATAQIVHVWDLADLDREGQFTIYNPDVDDAEFGTPVSAGDLNDDGLDDLIISAMAGDGPDNDRPNAGEVAIYFSPGRIGGRLDLAQAPPGVVTLYGEDRRDIFGIKTHVADLDGNGTDDLMVGAFYADTPEFLDAGKLYVFSQELLKDLAQTEGKLDLAATQPAGLGIITGPQRRGRLGVWMASGDVNGDGFEDIIVGADMAGGPDPDQERDQRGRVYVLYGPIASGQDIDLANTQHPLSVIYGVDARDHAGSTVASGDVNGDGYDDVVIGAAALGTLRNAYDREGGAGDGPDNSRPDCGELYVVFGGPNLPPQIELGANTSDILVAYGADGGGDSPDRLGEEFVLADVNGDGFDDILIGAYRADGPDNSRRDAGETYVVYGSATAPGQILDMAQNPAGVTVIYGATAGAIIGDSIAAGDIHGDGRDDLFIGVPGDDGPLERRFAGGMVIIAGDDLPAVIDLAAPQVPVVWIQAPDAFDFSAYWAASGDIDGDGRVDAIPNGMAGDGPNNERNNAGEAHIVSGRLLAQWLPATAATAVATATEAPLPDTPLLSPNFPNPFNAFTRIPFTLVDDNGLHTLDILALNGQHVRRLSAGHRPAGHYQATWDGHDKKGHIMASGVYLSRLRAGAQQSTTRMLLLK